METEEKVFIWVGDGRLEEVQERIEGERLGRRAA